MGKASRGSAPGLMVVSDKELEELPYDLHDLGAQAVETRDKTTMVRADGETCVYLAGFEDETARDLAAANIMSQYPRLEVSPTTITDDGWSDGWKRFFKPVVFDTLQIVTPWMDVDPGDRKQLVIDPGMAFGTGGHATTYLCLQELERYAVAGVLPERVLDVGCGSGIISIAAALFGVELVSGMDIDPEAVSAANENAQKNGVPGQVDFWVGGAESATGTWPLVIANIQLAVFLNVHSQVAQTVAPGGKLIVSGLLVEQRGAALSLWDGFSLVAEAEKEGWISLVLERIT